MWYKINTLDAFTGSLVLSNRSIVEIDTVNVAEEPADGTLVVAAKLGTDAAITGALKLTVAGVEKGGVEYKAVEGGGTGLFYVKSESAGAITVTDDDCDFTVDAATAATIAETMGVATDSENFGKAAIAYVVGGEVVDGEVVLPTPTITVADGKVTVVYDSGDANVGTYTVTCTLWSFELADANDPSKWTNEAEGAIGANLVDDEASGESKFYKVTVTVKDSQLGNQPEIGSGA